MSELADWLWIAVAFLWIVFRVLPRLFRKRGTETPGAGSPPARTVDPPESRHAEETGPGPGPAPPPIEPR